MSDYQCERWVGLVEVMPIKGDLHPPIKNNAYCTVVAWANNVSHFKSTVENELKLQRMQLISLEEVETVRERQEFFEVPDDFKQLIADVGPENTVAFSDFFVYPSGDD